LVSIPEDKERDVDAFLLRHAAVQHVVLIEIQVAHPYKSRTKESKA